MNASNPSETPPPITPARAAVLVVKGVCMGTADIIPGVSGGTVALILGVYNRLIEGIRSFRPSTVLALVAALPGLWNAAKRPALIGAARALHLDFLIPLGTGIASAVLVAAKFIPALLKEYPAQMNALFFGLIVASVYVPYAKMPRRNLLHAGLGMAAAVLAWWLVGLPMMSGEAGLGFIFVCGAVAICAMILPGISGSYMLKAMGQYEHILEALHARDLVTIGVFLLGIVVGITGFVRILSWMLRHFEAATLAALTGLMVGSLRSVWPYQQEIGPGAFTPVLPESFGAREGVLLAIALVGVAVVTGLIQVDRKAAAAAPSPGSATVR